MFGRLQKGEGVASLSFVRWVVAWPDLGLGVSGMCRAKVGVGFGS